MVFCNNGMDDVVIADALRHNPYFNRWFSAIINRGETMFNFEDVTILILIDGFLQYVVELLFLS